MLNRDWFDPLPLWPVVAWPIAFTSILYAHFIINKQLEQQGWTAGIYTRPKLEIYLPIYMYP